MCCLECGSSDLKFMRTLQKYKCRECDYLSEAILSEEHIFNSSSRFSINVHETSRNSIYQRENHFKDWIQQIQGKENLEIAEHDLRLIHDDLIAYYRRTFRDCESLQGLSINPNDVKLSLKRLNMTRYYENIILIRRLLTNVPPPQLESEDEENLMHMFRQVELAFEYSKGEKRKNILRYSYMLYKLMELLELDEMLPLFNMLKNRNKMIQQDKVWKRICEYNRWQFIPSI